MLFYPFYYSIITDIVYNYYNDLGTREILKSSSGFSFSGSIAITSYYGEIYKIRKLCYTNAYFEIANSNDGAWRYRFNNYPVDPTCTSHVCCAFKATGTYVPSYTQLTNNINWIVVQGGTGKYTVHILAIYTMA